jgi:RNA polymerase sigma-70 factor (ECF subfamily)
MDSSNHARDEFGSAGFELQSDRQLLMRFRDGERAALLVVYRAFVTEVETLCRRGFVLDGLKVPPLPGPMVMDAVQDVFLKAFSQSARLAYDGLRPYRPFLLQLARNVCIDRLRALGRAPQPLPADQESEDAQAESSQRSAEEKLDQARRVRLTQEYVAQLDPVSQQLVELRFVGELTQDETADKLAISRRRVRTLESRILAGLRKHLGRHRLA